MSTTTEEVINYIIIDEHHPRYQEIENEEEQLIITLTKEGHSQDSIRKQTGISIYRISRIQHKHDIINPIKTKPRVNAKLTIEQEKQIARNYERGITSDKQAKEYNVHQRTIEKIVRKHVNNNPYIINKDGYFKKKLNPGVFSRLSLFELISINERLTTDPFYNVHSAAVEYNCSVNTVKNGVFMYQLGELNTILKIYNEYWG